MQVMGQNSFIGDGYCRVFICTETAIVSYCGTRVSAFRETNFNLKKSLTCQSNCLAYQITWLVCQCIWLTCYRTCLAYQSNCLTCQSNYLSYQSTWVVRQRTWSACQHTLLISVLALMGSIKTTFFAEYVHSCYF